jgi:hypothetical protein
LVWHGGLIKAAKAAVARTFTMGTNNNASRRAKCKVSVADDEEVQEQ